MRKKQREEEEIAKKKAQTLTPAPEPTLIEIQSTVSE
jgi:hypothetical protein